MKDLPKLGVMMLSWEFPPRIIGGIAAHMYDLSMALARKGISVYVVTCEFPGAPEHEEINGVHIQRVDSYRYPTPDFGTWVSMMNANLQIKAADILESSRNGIHILHAHDWLVASASISLKHLFRIPLAATIHSTEYGRSRGILTDYQKMIASTEAWLAREAWRVICCSRYMLEQVTRALSAPDDKVDVIPNGVNTSVYEGPYNGEAVRTRFTKPGEKLVLYVGRLVREKGVDLLVEAMPTVLEKVNARFVIVGEGHLKEELLRKVKEIGVSERAYIAGFIDTDTLRQLLRAADVCAVPSIYEPFGIVVLEAMAARTPIVTTGAGGIREIVEHDISASLVQPTSNSIAAGIIRVLTDTPYADQLRRGAYEKVTSVYGWDAIAERTLQTYLRIIKEFERGKWKPR